MRQGDLLAATETLLQEVVDATMRQKRAFKGKERIALRVGRVIGKYKMKKHFILHIDEDAFSFERNEASIAKEAQLDGFYVIRTSVSNSANSGDIIHNYYWGMRRNVC